VSLESYPKGYLMGSGFANKYSPWGIMRGMGTLRRGCMCR